MCGNKINNENFWLLVDAISAIVINFSVSEFLRKYGIVLAILIRIGVIALIVCMIVL